MTIEQIRETIEKEIRADREHDKAAIRKPRGYRLWLSRSMIETINELYRFKGWPEIEIEGENSKNNRR